MDKTILMEKVIAGKASPQEEKEFEEWLTQSAANREEYKDVKWLIESANTFGGPPESNDESWRKIESRVEKLQIRQRYIRLITKAFVVAVILVALYFLFHWLGERYSQGRSWSAGTRKPLVVCTDSSIPHESERQV